MEDDQLEGGTPLETDAAVDNVETPADETVEETASGEEQETTEDEQPAPKPKRSMLDDLRAERQARKEAEAKAREYEAYIAGRQHAPEAPAQPQGPDPELVELAETLGLFDKNGNPDVASAERVARFTSQVAEQQVRRYVAPMHQTMAQQQAEGLRGAMMQHAESVGIDQSAVEQVASLIPDELLVQPNVAQLVLAVAGGLERMRGGQAAPRQAAGAPQVRRGAPLFTEPSGGKRTVANSVSAPFRNVLQNAGVTDKDLESSLKDWKPGVPITLE